MSFVKGNMFRKAQENLRHCIEVFCNHKQRLRPTDLFEVINKELFQLMRDLVLVLAEGCESCQEASQNCKDEAKQHNNQAGHPVKLQYSTVLLDALQRNIDVVLYRGMTGLSLGKKVMVPRKEKQLRNAPARQCRRASLSPLVEFPASDLDYQESQA